MTLSLLSLNTMARPSELLRCLGVEEQRLHKAKSQGPEYQLNQQLISELVQVQNVDLRPELLKKICSSAVSSPSRMFLYTLLDNGKSIFEFSHGITGFEKSIAESMLEDFVLSSQQIVLGYIATIQQESPTADCLKKNIPELDLLYVDMKYLEEEVETKYLFKKKGLAEKILGKLSDYPAILKKCQPSKDKKTDKSGSTAKRKKS